MTQNPTVNAGQSVPDNVAHAAANARLGPLQRVFVPKRLNWFLLVFLILIGLATLIILVGFFLLWMAFRSPNLNGSFRRRRLYLYEQGFVLAERPDDPQVFRWDDIRTVYQRIVSQRTYGVETARTYLYTVTRRDGRTVKLTQFWAEIAQLGPHVNTCVSTALLPGAVAAIRHGQSLDFGDMTVNATGIAGRRKSVAWREISQVQIANGYVRVGIAGKFFSLSTTAASNIPNLPLFFALTDELRKQSR